MDSNAILLATGNAVKIKGKTPIGSNYELLPTTINASGEKLYIENTSGCVLEFYIEDEKKNSNIKYIYIDQSLIFQHHKKNNRAKKLNGYCREDAYIEYKNFSPKYYSDVNKFIDDSIWFNDFEYAKNDDIITINRYEFDDYTKYYVEKSYSFMIIDIVNTNFFSPTTYPLNTTVIDKSKNLLDEIRGKFYNQNLPLFNNIQPSVRNVYAKELSFICLKISQIIEEILQLNIINKETYDYIKNAFYQKFKHNDSINYIKLNNTDLLIGNLMKDWGYINGLDAKYMFEGKSLTHLQDYYNNLTSFYTVLVQAKSEVYFGYDMHGNPLDFNGNPITLDGINIDGQIIHISQEAKDRADDERRLALLLKYLPTDSISIFDYNQRISIINKILNLGKDVPTDSGTSINQNNLLKLIASFSNASDADKFLKFLLDNNGIINNFTKLYHIFNDDFLQIDFLIIDNLINNVDRSRKIYVYIIYSIWKYSLYNPNHIPLGVTPNEQGLNPNSYFLTPEGKLYFENPQGEAVTDKSLEFDFIEENQDAVFYFYSIDKNFYNNKIKIIREKRKATDPYAEYSDQKDLWYHLYQPILILGYKSVDTNEQLYLPKIPRVPAFLFYYFKEHEEKYKTNALLNFGVQVTTDALLTFFTGGFSEIAEIRYLKYLSESGKILLKPSVYESVNTTVKLWKIVNTAERVSFVASTFANFATYLSETSGNDKDKEFYGKMRMLAFLVMLGTGLGSLVAQRKAMSQAEDLLEMLSKPGLTVALSNDAKAFLISIAQTDKYLQCLIDKIDLIFLPSLGIDAAPLKNAFLALTKEEKLGFYFDFIQMQQQGWVKMSEVINGEVRAVKNWKKLYKAGATDRVMMDVITSDTQTADLLKLYEIISFKKKLETIGYVKRWQYVNAFKNIDDVTFDLLKKYPESIDVFFKHTPEARKLLGKNAEIWMKYFEARNLLKNKQYSELANLFGEEIGESTIEDGIRYVTQGSFDPEDLKDAIAIANRTDDVAIISEKLEITFEILNQAKKHYYIDEHIMVIDGKFRIGRFERGFEDNREWLEFVDKDINEIEEIDIVKFKRLIAHEYIESRLMEKGIYFRSFVNPDNMFIYDNGAHWLSTDLNNGFKFINFGQIKMPPKIDEKNLSNLDEIVEYYIDLLKL